jgi:RecA/RadA recombinase
MAKKEETKKETGSFIGRLKKAAKTEYADVMSDFDSIQPRDFISSGNYLFNALLSADINKGIPSGKVVSLTGPAGCGKTFTALEILKNAQKMGYTGILYDSEFANNDNEALKQRGIDTEKLLYIPIDTVENLKTSILNILEEITTNDKVMIIIDSLGNLSTNKEMNDSMDGSDKKDMTRAAQLKALFRTITMKAGVKQVSIVAINHVYAVVGAFFAQNVAGGGSGPAYMSSIVIEFSKAQDKEGTDIVGAIITAKSVKNRFAKERSKIKFSINFNTGMNPYAGLLGFCEDEKIFKKDGQGYIYKDVKYGRKELASKAFWDNLLQAELGTYIHERFKYSSVVDEILGEDLLDSVNDDNCDIED